MIEAEAIFVMWLSVAVTFVGLDEFLWWKYVEHYLGRFGLVNVPFGPGMGWFLFFWFKTNA